MHSRSKELQRRDQKAYKFLISYSVLKNYLEEKDFLGLKQGTIMSFGTRRSHVGGWKQVIHSGDLLITTEEKKDR